MYVSRVDLFLLRAETLEDRLECTYVASVNGSLTVAEDIEQFLDLSR
jgi:hypothetical protein